MFQKVESNRADFATHVRQMSELEYIGRCGIHDRARQPQMLCLF